MSEKHIGKVIQVTGPVLDIRFPEGELPALLNAIEIDNHGEKLIVEVAQQTGDHTVRCIAMKSTDGLVPRWIRENRLRFLSEKPVLAGCLICWERR